MALVEGIIFCIFTESIYISILEVFLLCNAQYLATIGCSKELTLLVEKLESIPLAWVMRSCDDDTTGSTTHGYSQLCSRSSSQTDVQYIVTHTHQSSTNYILYHLARDTCITANHDGVALRSTATTDECSVSRCKLDDVERIQSIARWTADRSTDTRNRLNQCHNNIFLK